MAVDLAKHRDDLLDTWRDVLDDKTATNWALFGYEKQSNSLMVVEKGDGGLEELNDELNSAKIMYAFCRVIDPNTSLIKYVLINWQGEGAPLSRKGCCANHVQDITNFFKGTHITINARTEDDMDPSVVMDKVSKSTGSKFNFKERSEPSENFTPVGSVYKRIQPAKEFNSREREKFWMKEQEEEKRRLEAENKKREIERAKMEQEVREREMKEAVRREERVLERNKSITEVREAEQNAENTARNVKFEKMQWEKQMKDDVKEEKERRWRSESLRRERSQEAQVLISKRTFNARAIFEQNSSAGQMNSFQNSVQLATPSTTPLSSTSSVTTPQEPHPPSNKTVISPAVQSENYSQQSVKSINVESPEERLQRSDMTFTLYSSEATLDQGNDVPSPAPPERPLPGSNGPSSEEREYQNDFNYTRNLLKEGLPPRQETELEDVDEEQNWDEPSLEAPPEVRDTLSEMLAEHGITPPTSNQGSAQQSPQIISANVGGDGLRARALYDYQAADETEISFDPDDLITHIEQIDEGWWQGMGPDGSYGLFPANYVELIE